MDYFKGMWTIRTLLQTTTSHKAKLFTNATKVGVSFNSTRIGNDERGYFKEVSGIAKTLKRKTPKCETEPHHFQIRIYFETGYIPPSFRTKGELYRGPETPKSFTIGNKAWFMCDCPYHKYACEEALTKRAKGNSELRHSNGSGYHNDGPNPSGTPNLCKHIIQSLRMGALLKK